jgi:hypothetical protein
MDYFRYLDPDSNEISDEENGNVLVIYASLPLLILSCLGFDVDVQPHAMRVVASLQRKSSPPLEVLYD